MRVVSPEKCAEILDQHADNIFKITAKLQVIIESFRIIGDGKEPEFDDFGIFATGIVEICQDAVKKLYECDLEDISNNLKLLSPDNDKILKQIAYLESIGIRDQSATIDLEE